MPRRPTVSMILRATSEIISHDGVEALTLDAVAHRAGISKGGLLYHFPSKEALLSALILHQLDEFEADLERRAAVLPDGPGRWLRAYVEATFDPSHTLGPDLVGALMAAFAEDPRMLDVVQSRYQRWRQTTQDDADDRVLAAIVQLAADGLFLADLLGFGPAGGAERDALRSAMTRLAGGPASAPRTRPRQSRTSNREKLMALALPVELAQIGAIAIILAWVIGLRLAVPG